MEQFWGEGWSRRELRVPDLATLHGLGVPIPTSVISLLLSTPNLFVSYIRIGFPFRSFSGETYAPLGTPTMNSNFRFLAAVPPISSHGWWFIPYRPLPGLFYSWAFWSALAYLALSGLSFMRITSRLKKGRCPKCAYDLGGVPRCPECGTIVHKAAPAPSPLGGEDVAVRGDR